MPSQMTQVVSGACVSIAVFDLVLTEVGYCYIKAL